MSTRSVKPRLAAFNLRPGYTPLPSERMAPEVGPALALVKSLCLATDQHRSLEMNRLWNGDFVRRTYSRGTFAQTSGSRREQVGSLLAALDAAPNFGTSVSERRYFGIPQLEDETDLAGALLIRLFEVAERVKADVTFEYTPWAQKPLRYRLRYVLTVPLIPHKAHI